MNIALKKNIECAMFVAPLATLVMRGVYELAILKRDKYWNELDVVGCQT